MVSKCKSQVQNIFYGTHRLWDAVNYTKQTRCFCAPGGFSGSSSIASSAVNAYDGRAISARSVPKIVRNGQLVGYCHFYFEFFQHLR